MRVSRDTQLCWMDALRWITSRWYGINSSKAVWRMPLSFLKLWQIMRHGFDMPGACNDINMLHWSPLVAWLAIGESPPVEFQANGHSYNMSHYLANWYIQSGKPLWSQFQDPKVRNNLVFIILEQLLGRMSRGRLGFCKPNLLLCEDRRVLGRRNP